MNNFITLNQVKKRLHEKQLRYETLELQDGWSVIACEYGGRVFGPFKGDESESIFWMSDVFKTEQAFDELISKRHWNIGGDRFWVAPELPFFVKEKKDFFGTYTVQGALDPGDFSIVKSGDSVKLAQNVKIEAYETAGRQKSFAMERTIKQARNPLLSAESTKALSGTVDYFGFVQEALIRDTGKDRSLYLESWLLTQINPKGKLIVPFSGTDVEYTDYYEPISEKLFSVKANRAYVDVTGDERYKLGFKATNVTGRAGYLGELTDGTCYLFVRNYFNNPSNIYCAAPFFAPEQYGCSLYLYNDPGSQGGFAEFENSGTTISGDTGISSATDSIYYYFFVGAKKDLIKIADMIL